MLVALMVASVGQQQQKAVGRQPRAGGPHTGPGGGRPRMWVAATRHCDNSTVCIIELTWLVDTFGSRGMGLPACGVVGGGVTAVIWLYPCTADTQF
jgi:hypothetical protein